MSPPSHNVFKQFIFLNKCKKYKAIVTTPQAGFHSRGKMFLNQDTALSEFKIS